MPSSESAKLFLLRTRDPAGSTLLCKQTDSGPQSLKELTMRMRPWLPCALAMTMLAAAVPTAHSQSVFDKLKQKAKDKVNQKEDHATDAAVNSADPTNKSGSTNNDSGGSTAATSASAPAEAAAAPAEGAAPAAPVTLIRIRTTTSLPARRFSSPTTSRPRRMASFPISGS